MTKNLNAQCARHRAPSAVAGAAAGIAATALSLGLWQLARARRAEPAQRHLADWRAYGAQQARAARQLDHDMRAPVGAMAVALELMRTTDDPALRLEALQVLERQVARMNTLTQRLHELSREFNG